MDLSVREGELLFPRTPELVAAYNARVGAEALTWNTLQHGIRAGTRTRSGVRLRIPTVKFGRKLFTSLEAIDRWSRAVAEADSPVVVESAPSKPASRRGRPSIDHDEVDRILDAEGL